MRTKTPVLLLLALCSVLAACQDDGLADGTPSDGSYDCSSCHGSSVNPAPPTAAKDGIEDTSYVGVGAHQIHLVDGAVHKAFDCEVCHPTPDPDDPLAHVDALPAEVTFGDLARMGDMEPQWDRDKATCGSVYCHGAGLEIGGGKFTTPSWTFADGAHPGYCAGCHGNPPPAPHPQDGDCNACHPSTVRADGIIDLGKGLHINGTVDVDMSGATCDACHGFPPAAPHPDSVACDACHGATVTADGTIDEAGGLHQDGTIQWSPGPESCDKCHGNPPAPPHPEDTACANCHGDTVKDDGSVDLDGGFHMNGTVEVASGPESCSLCHGDPPPLPHPQVTTHQQCAWCHSDTVNDAGDIDAAGGHHMNGTVESNGFHPDGFLNPAIHGNSFNSDGAGGCVGCHGEDLLGGVVGVSCDKCHPSFRTNCTFCHGGEVDESGAPPEAVYGETGTDFAGVGAHQAHLVQNPFWHKAHACGDCHATYTDALDPGHINGQAELVWSELASSEDATPSYEAGTCSGVYCHGGALEDGDGALTAPDWTTVDGTQAACGNCHALPPGGDHPQNSDCSMCHGCVATSEPAIREEGAAFHINGEINMQPAGACPTDDD